MAYSSDFSSLSAPPPSWSGQLEDAWLDIPNARLSELNAAQNHSVAQAEISQIFERYVASAAFQAQFKEEAAPFNVTFTITPQGNLSVQKTDGESINIQHNESRIHYNRIYALLNPNAPTQGGAGAPPPPGYGAPPQPYGYPPAPGYGGYPPYGPPQPPYGGYGYPQPHQHQYDPRMTPQSAHISGQAVPHGMDPLSRRPSVSTSSTSMSTSTIATQTDAQTQTDRLALASETLASGSLQDAATQAQAAGLGSEDVWATVSGYLDRNETDKASAIIDYQIQLGRYFAGQLHFANIDNLLRKGDSHGKVNYTKELHDELYYLNEARGKDLVGPAAERLRSGSDSSFYPTASEEWSDGTVIQNPALFLRLLQEQMNAWTRPSERR